MINDCVQHEPVLLKEVLHYLNASQEGVYVDATFGAGGYSSAILSSNKKNKILAIDRDPNVNVTVDQFKKRYGERFSFVQNRFSQLEECLRKENIELVDGIVFDLGVSSMQLDNGERGFSFSKKAELDMRMGNNDISAYEVVNDFPEEEIANIIWQYGEESYARKIAKSIVQERSISPIKYTTDLAKIITAIKPEYKSKIHPATKSFQAIRIFVNKELEELRRVLEVTKKILKKGGRLVVVSFHGLEDKIVKYFIKQNGGKQSQGNRYLPVIESKEQYFSVITNKIIKAGLVEIERNPRSRSAILRAVERI